MRFFTRLFILTSALTGLLSAEVSYQQTTKFKGGALIDMVQKMASMPMMGRMMGGNGMKQAFQDQTAQIYIKGNKMARIATAFSTIYDLDAGTVTTINHEKQTYAVQTFDEMRQRMEEMQARMSKSQGGEMQFDVKVDKTNRTQEVDGEKAKEVILTMTAKQANEQGQMVVTVDSWIVPMNPLRREVTDFHRKLAEKLAGAMGGMSPMMGAANGGLAAAMKEMAKMDDGYPATSESVVKGVTSVGGPMGAMGAMGGGNGNIDPNTPLIDTETINSNFVKGVADDSKFSVPASYKEEKARGGRRP